MHVELELSSIYRCKMKVRDARCTFNTFTSSSCLLISPLFQKERKKKLLHSPKEVLLLVELNMSQRQATRSKWALVGVASLSTNTTCTQSQWPLALTL